MSADTDRMIIFCKECGKKYAIDPNKIKGDTARARCKKCQNIIEFSKKPDELPSWVSEIMTEESESDPAVVKAPPALDASEPVKIKFDNIAKPTKRRFGLTAKFMVFILTPFLIISFLSIFYSTQKILNAQNLTIRESATIVKGIGEELIFQIARSVAKQTRLYLFSHPDLSKDRFNRDIYFKKVAVQRIGRTGHTALFELPGPDGAWKSWAHLDHRAVGVNIKSLENFPEARSNGFWKILSGLQNKRETAGYYRVKERKGGDREKYMVCMTVEGTPYVIVASIFVDEFTVPLKKLHAIGTILAKNMLRSNAIIMGIGILLIGIIIFLYVRQLTVKILSLADITDRISLGELDKEITVRSTDEIGELVESIARLQTSIKLSIERLRRRQTGRAS